MASGSFSRRPESRLLDSAVRDAVGPVGVSNSSVNSLRRKESGVKRLRSVVVGNTGNPDLPSEENGHHYHLKPRLEMGLQGSKVPPGVAVALKAAAAAAEDVNNNSMKNRMRSFGNIWDRLGNRSSESLGLKENGAQEATRVNAGNEQEDEIMEETKETKRPRWRNIAERLGPRGEDDIAVAPDVNHGGFGYVGQGKGLVENKWYGPRRRSAEEARAEVDRFGDVANYPNGDFFRYGTMNEPFGDVSGTFQDPSGRLFYRLGERAAQGLPNGFIPGLSGAVNFPNRLPNIHINSNARYLLPNDVNMGMNGPLDFYSQRSKHGAGLEISSGLSPAVVDANDVLEMKKRMRQVQLEMTKLRAKQAEVSKEAQKAGRAPVSVGKKPRSQEEIDLHSVCVTNVHFAATKEMIAAHFSHCGDIVRVTVLMDTTTRKPKGSAYVEFSSKDGVEKALTVNDSSLLSRTLKVVRKDAAMVSTVPPTVGRPSHVPYSSMRPPGKFMRGNLRSMRRPVSMPRPFAAHLQWKREALSPADKAMTPNFGNKNGSSIRYTRRIAALRNRSSSVMGWDRYGLGPIRMTRSLSYVRPAPYPSREAIQVALQKT